MLELLILISLVLFGSVFALIGGLIFLSVPRWSEALAMYSVPFAGGVLLTVALLGVLPESVEILDHSAFLITLITFLIIFLFENVFFSLHHHEDEGHHHLARRSAWFVMLGDTIHNFIDGVAIAAAFITAPGLGLITAISTFLHEVPHEIGDFGILLKAKWSKRNIIFTNLFSAFASLVGALAVYLVKPSENILGLLLAISAGIFLYLGASDFLPHAGQHLSKGKMIFALLSGVGLMLLSILSIPHAH